VDRRRTGLLWRARALLVIVRAFSGKVDAGFPQENAIKHKRWNVSD
jgi:hypothetical protein